MVVTDKITAAKSNIYMMRVTGDLDPIMYSLCHRTVHFVCEQYKLTLRLIPWKPQNVFNISESANMIQWESFRGWENKIYIIWSGKLLYSILHALQECALKNY